MCRIFLASFLFFLIAISISAEGSNELGTAQTLKSETILYVDILDHTTESIHWNGTGSVTIYGPSGTTIGTITSGSSITPSDGNGAYMITMDTDNSNWDISVKTETFSHSGRLFSYQWEMDQNGYNFPMTLSLFAVVPTGGMENYSIVEVFFNDLAGFENIKLLANHNGTSAGHFSVNSTGVTAEPEYPLYLNIPEKFTQNPISPTLSPVSSNSYPGLVEIHFDSDIKGTAVAIVDINQDGTYDPTDPSDKAIFSDIETGSNTMLWFGYDNEGTPVPNGSYNIEVHLLGGQLNIPLLDIETSYQGFRLFAVNNDLSKTPLDMFWNDQSIQAAAVLMPNGSYGLERSGLSFNSGSFSNPTLANVNARSWGNFNISGNGKGNENYLNTWTYLAEDIAQINDVSMTDAGSPISTTNPPVLTGPLYETDLSISGSSDNAALIKIYVDGLLWGNTTASSGGSWTAIGAIGLTGNQEVYATAKVLGELVSDPSSTIIVIPDRDGDQIADADDNCIDISNADQSDVDLDNIGDVCDNCPSNSNSDQLDTDIDNVGDICDNCPTASNENQLNSDSDAFGDACDNCPSITNAIQSDIDNDGLGDLCDSDILTNENVGIGTDNPKTKLHIKGGQIFFDSSLGNLILKSQNGSCWLLRVDNTGNLSTTQIDCPI